jgi:4-diphosphocytidyl-2C-methyl-D-erythritol kinase
MNIKIKSNECWGTAYVVLFKIDEVETIGVFTDIDEAETFTTKVNGKLFTETLNRYTETNNKNNSTKMMNISKPNRPEVKEYFQKQLESIR